MAKITVSSLQKFKQQGHKFSSITAYDASFAALFDQAGVELMLIGDSMGMVLHGKPDTLAVSIDDIAYHTRCVAAGTKQSFILADMPFMSYASPEQTYANAGKLMAAGAQMVKLEGGEWLCETIKGLVQRGVPVCGHLGLTPQSVHVFGGFKVQGRINEQAQQLIDDAKALEAAGAQLLVIECVPVEVAKAITEALSIPVIGIGAGDVTDGQILVMHDVLGISHGHIPKFSKNYLAQTGNIQLAIETYIQEVAEGRFPTAEHSFK